MQLGCFLKWFVFNLTSICVERLPMKQIHIQNPRKSLTLNITKVYPPIRTAAKTTIIHMIKGKKWENIVEVSYIPLAVWIISTCIWIKELLCKRQFMYRAEQKQWDTSCYKRFISPKWSATSQDLDSYSGD